MSLVFLFNFGKARSVQNLIYCFVIGIVGVVDLFLCCLPLLSWCLFFFENVIIQIPEKNMKENEENIPG